MSISSSLEDFCERLRAFMTTSLEFVHADASSSAAEHKFDELALELFALQFDGNQAYRQLCRRRGLSPQSIDHWSHIPVLPTTAFKELEITCLPPNHRLTVFHSSGTSEQRPSRHFHNPRSLAVYKASVVSWFSAVLRHHLQGKAQSSPPPFVLATLTPPPDLVPHSSLVHMFETIREFVDAEEDVFFGQVEPGGGWVLDVEAVARLLEELRGGPRPVLMLGTAFSYVHLLDHLALEQRQFELAPGSCVLETGGYKGRSRQLPKGELQGLITTRLGVPQSNIVCEYGMSELSSQAYAIGEGVFHFPPWARAQLVSAETGREVSPGEPGLIRVFDLANVYSALGIQTEDLAIRREDGFELLGRAPLAEARGCSLMAMS